MRKVLQIMGPGLLFAGSSIGVSHLIQSTRAGAMFNFDLIWVLVIALILKYPFFEYGPRYAVATGTSLIEGYRKIGKWAVLLFATITVLSMFIIQATVTVVTVGLLAHIIQVSINITWLSVFILISSGIILLWGKYGILDKLIKFIVIALTVATIVAVFAALGIRKEVTPDFLTQFQWTRSADIFFLIAFVGWMPSPIDVSVWTSIWNLEKFKSLGFTPQLNHVVSEFKIGYILTGVVAIGFVGLGALVMHGTGQEFSPKGTVFAEQLINMYTASIGNWSYWIISIAAFTTMFSTTITVLDAYSRVLTPICDHLTKKVKHETKEQKSLPWLWVLVIVLGATLIIAFADKTMVVMVTIATTLSFLTAPVMAWLNYRVVTDKHMPIGARPGIALKILSWLGITFLSVFSFIYLYWYYLA